MDFDIVRVDACSQSFEDAPYRVEGLLLVFACSHGVLIVLLSRVCLLGDLSRHPAYLSRVPLFCLSCHPVHRVGVAECGTVLSHRCLPICPIISFYGKGFLCLAGGVSPFTAACLVFSRFLSRLVCSCPLLYVFLCLLVLSRYNPVRQKTTGLARWMNAVKSF